MLSGWTFVYTSLLNRLISISFTEFLFRKNFVNEEANICLSYVKNLHMLCKCLELLYPFYHVFEIQLEEIKNMEKSIESL